MLPTLSPDTMIETERLVLRQIDPTFAPQTCDYAVRNRAFFQPWWPLLDESFYTLAGQQLQLAADCDQMNEGRMLKLWIFTKNNSKFTTIIGKLSFNSIVRGAFQSCFLGYDIDEAVSNRGYMTEALGAAIDVVFRILRLHRIEANIIPRNLRSRRVVEKLGFACEGLSPAYLKINGVWEDHLHYVILNPDNTI